MVDFSQVYSGRGAMPGTSVPPDVAQGWGKDPNPVVAAPNWGKDPNPVVAAPEAPQGRLGDYGIGAIPVVGPVLSNIPTSLKPTEGWGNGSQIAGGMSASLSNLIGQPAEIVDRALNLIGGKIMSRPGAAQDAVGNFFASLGVPPDRSKTFFAQVGQEMVPQLAGLAGLWAIAERMVLKEGVDLGSAIIRSLGEFIKKQPARALAQDIGGTAGAVAGKRAEESTGVPGLGILGSLMGGYGTDLVYRAGSAVGNTGRRIVNSLAGKIAGNNTLGPALMSDNPEAAARATEFAKTAVAGSTARLDQIIGDTINKIPANVTTDELIGRLGDLGGKAGKIANRIEGKLWGKVQSKMPADLSPLDNLAKTMRREGPLGNPDAIPTARLDEITAMVASDKPTLVSRLLGFRTQLADEESRIFYSPEGRRLIPKRGEVSYARNLGRLIDKVDEVIQVADPGNQALANAREFSKQKNDLLVRSPFGRFLRSSEDSDPMVAFQDMLKRNGATDKLTQLQGLTANPNVNIPKSWTDTSEALGKTYEATITQTFRDAVAGGTPADIKAGEAFLKRFERNIKPLGSTFADMDKSVETLGRALEAKRVVQESDLAEISGMAADNAVRYVLSGPNPVERAAAIMKTIGTNEDARGGLVSGMIKELIQRSNASGNRMVNEMMKPSVRGAVEAVMTPGEFARWNRMVQAAKRIEDGDIRLEHKFLGGPIRIGLRVVGAHIGRTVSRVGGGGGNIQTPAIFSTIFGNLVTKHLPEDALFRLAVINPRFEKALLGRVGSTTKEMKNAAATFRKIAAIEQGLSTNDISKTATGVGNVAKAGYGLSKWLTNTGGTP